MQRLGRMLVQGLTSSGVRVAFLDTTTATNTAITRHNINSLPTKLRQVTAQALSRTLNSAVLLNMSMKGEERVEVQVLAEDPMAPLNKVHVESISTGEVRGHIVKGASIIEDGDDVNDINSVAEALNGLGATPILVVNKVLYDHAEKQQSFVEVPGGLIENGLRHFYETSEQIDTNVQLHADFSEDPTTGFVFTNSGATLLQRMPDVSDSDWDAAQHLILQHMPQVRQEVLTAAATSRDLGSDLQATLGRIVPELTFEAEAFSRKPIDFYCRCNRDHFRDILQRVEPEMKDDMKQQGEPVSVTCNHCNELYTFEVNELFE